MAQNLLHLLLLQPSFYGHSSKRLHESRRIFSTMSTPPIRWQNTPPKARQKVNQKNASLPWRWRGTFRTAGRRRRMSEEGNEEIKLEERLPALVSSIGTHAARGSTRNQVSDKAMAEKEDRFTFQKRKLL
ncbi:hypothetical protein H5410_010337 [Solanum commersonii]|uniref:Uncharacterized protein n=1 Tax=Solanum commersonii TaxID=4109 RepID=A0A9J6AM58_SOLCO|nr:hypothetical protein H5410_010337 [Solanum commersonii]